MPLNILSIHFDSWIEEKINILNLIKIYMQFYSGIWMNILVPRNKVWFQALLPKIQDTWNIIQKERIHGYNHRMPNQRQKKN